MSNDLLVWIDCEMTGLDLSRDALIEVACIVTKGDLVELDEGISVVIKPPPDTVTQMSEIVRTMHTESGLLPLLDGGIPLRDAEDTVVSYIRRHVPESQRPPLAGSSVYVDRGFLARDMPTLDSLLHYRLVDVSSLKELVRRWYPRVAYAAPGKRGGHRALADTRDSIAELRYYRDTVLVPPPGPDTESAREVAALHQHSGE